MTDTQMTKYLRDRRKSEFIEPLDERPGHMPGARCQNPSCLYIKTTRTIGASSCANLRCPHPHHEQITMTTYQGHVFRFCSVRARQPGADPSSRMRCTSPTASVARTPSGPTSARSVRTCTAPSIACNGDSDSALVTNRRDRERRAHRLPRRPGVRHRALPPVPEVHAMTEITVTHDDRDEP